MVPSSAEADESKATNSGSGPLCGVALIAAVGGGFTVTVIAEVSEPVPPKSSVTVRVAV